MTEQQKEIDLDSWQDFAGEYLKADLIAEFPVVLVPIDVFAFYDEERKKSRLVISVEFMRREWKFELNKTNQSFIRNKGIKSPKALIGKKLTFEKVKVRNPQTNSMVFSLLITNVE